MQFKQVSVEKMWQDFSAFALSSVSKETIQYSECKRVYFAAIWDALFTVMNTVGSEAYTEEQGVLALNDMMDQVKTFIHSEAASKKKWK